MSSLPAVNRVQTIRDLLAKSKGQIAAALPRHLTPDRMLRIAMTSIQSNYRLMECDPKSRGFLDLARRSGQVITLYAHVVHENDEWDFEYGLEPTLHHKPTKDDPGEMVGAYAVVRLKDGGYDFEWMWRREIDAIRRSSKAAGDGPWVTHYEEMAKKTVIRRLAKRLPLSIEFQRAAVADEYAEAGVFTEDVVDMTTGEVVDVQAKTKMKHRGSAREVEEVLPARRIPS
ncbi:MAG: recombinase RecT [Deltaproteobacteria bacterium]|nr:recombinase RecT [Deltaproteobacteria bacterium]